MKPLLTYRGSVAAWHCDHNGHMNVMWYVGKFDEATWNFLNAIGISPAYLRDELRAMVAVDHQVNYSRELLAGDVVEVWSRLVEVRSKGVVFTHQMLNAATGEVAATCKFTGIHIDRMTRKACPFTPGMRENAERFLPGASVLSGAA